MIIKISIVRINVDSGYRYNSSDPNNDILIEFGGEITKPLSKLSESIKINREVSGEFTNQPVEENHFMVSLEELTSNFIGYVSLSKSFGNESEYSLTVYIQPNEFMLYTLVNGQEKTHTLKLSCKNKFSEATAFSVPRDTGKLLSFELEGEIIIPIYAAGIEYDMH